MEIIDRTRYRRLQGFFLQVETGRPVTLLERLRNVNATWRNLHEIALTSVWNCDTLPILLGMIPLTIRRLEF